MPTGLPKADAKNPRLHFDIYAILEGSQELYLGHEVQVNVNLVETVKISSKNGDSMEKGYISPTKRKGVERRCLLWAPVKTGVLLGDKQNCGIPDTCTKIGCPICSVYGGLVTKDREDRKRATFIGRVTHAGGVAVQNVMPLTKQRAMHPALMLRNEATSQHLSKEEREPTPFKREYNQPGILYPIYNHALSVTDQEFASVAYAFLDSLARIGSGNPKGVALAESDDKMPLLVVDRYLVPRGKRPVISPSITSPEEAIASFIDLANSVNAADDETAYEGTAPTFKAKHFARWIGDAALTKLQDYSSQFVDTVLQA